VPATSARGSPGTFEQQYVPRLGEKAANTAVGKAITHVQESKAAAKVHSWGDAVKHLNSEIESSYREASYLTAIEKMQGKSAITRAGRSFWEREAADGIDHERRVQRVQGQARAR
jgi:hypothetical protein